MQVQELVGIVPWNFIATICNLFIQVYLCLLYTSDAADD